MSKTKDKEAYEAKLARVALEDNTPDDQLSPEALKRKQDRAYKRQQRGTEKKEKIAAESTSQQQWYYQNRAMLTPDEFSALLQQNSLVLDQLHWMDHGHKIIVEDPDYISVKDGVNDLLAFVKEVGIAHLGAIHRNPNIPWDWSQQNFWQDPELLSRLEAESEPTKVYVRTGLLSALPDWRVVDFLHEKAYWDWWKAAVVVGWCQPQGQGRVVVKDPCR